MIWRESPTERKTISMKQLTRIKLQYKGWRERREDYNPKSTNKNSNKNASNLMFLKSNMIKRH